MRPLAQPDCIPICKLLYDPVHNTKFVFGKNVGSCPGKHLNTLLLVVKIFPLTFSNSPLFL